MQSGPVFCARRPQPAGKPQGAGPRCAAGAGGSARADCPRRGAAQGGCCALRGTVRGTRPPASPGACLRGGPGAGAHALPLPDDSCHDWGYRGDGDAGQVERPGAVAALRSRHLADLCFAGCRRGGHGPCLRHSASAPCGLPGAGRGVCWPGRLAVRPLQDRASWHVDRAPAGQAWRGPPYGGRAGGRAAAGHPFGAGGLAVQRPCGVRSNGLRAEDPQRAGGLPDILCHCLGHGSASCDAGHFQRATALPAQIGRVAGGRQAHLRPGSACGGRLLRVDERRVAGALVLHVSRRDAGGDKRVRRCVRQD